MSADRFTLDTNVLFYASDDTHPAKRDLAQSLIRTAAERDCVLTLQSLAELFHALRKRQVFSAAAAKQIVSSFGSIFPVIPATEADLAEAILAHQQHHLQFWDALLWATAHRAGCTLLLSEDGHDGRTLGGLITRNPFPLSAADLATLLA